MTALERLEKQLDEKDERIEELERKISEYEDESEASWEWARHKRVDSEENVLPLPRLEIICNRPEDDWYIQIWDYRLVYKHFLGHIVYIPLGQTKRSGGNLKPVDPTGNLDLPFRDGAHIKHDKTHFNLRAFAVCEDIVQEL